MEIRARIGLEVAKFQANAKIVAAQFKAMGTSAERYQANVDHYSKRSLDTSKSINAARVQDTSKTGQAIVAREKKIADDRYSAIMQGARKAEKDKSKLELDAVRNRGGIRAGTNVGRPMPVRAATPAVSPVAEKEALAMAQMSARQRAGYERQLAKEFKAIQKQKLAASKAFVKERDAAEKAAAEKQKGLATRAVDHANKQLKRRADAEKAEAQKQKALATRAIEHANAQLNRKEKASQKALRSISKDAKDSSQLKWFNSKDFERQLASTRYALYDLGQRGAAAGLAIAGGIALAVAEAAKFESAFTSVERTARVSLNPDASGFENTAVQARKLKDALLDMSTAIPIAFADLSNIATLGAQLGIATDDLDEFTETVAKFSAITGISVDQAALSFGRLSELLDVDPSQFENISSAIVFAGINAVATDAEIVKMAESIAAASTQAGLAAADTLGFATALASLKVRPEEARGVITRLFREFDLAVSAGGERLDDFAKVLGKTTEETTNIWKTDPSQFVQSFLSGAQAGDKLNETMTALGIVNTRELNVITRLANNMDVLEAALADTNEQYLLGTFASDAYGLVVDDLSSKITMMQNAIAEAGASFGDVLSPAVKFLVDIIKGLAESITSLPPGVKAFIAIIAAAAAAAALLFSGLAFGIAGLLALKLAFKNLAGEGISAGLTISTFRNLLISMIPAATGARTATQALTMQARASSGAFLTAAASASVFQKALGIIGVAFAVVSTAYLAIDAVANSMANAKKEAEELAQANFDAAGGLQAFIDASESGKDTGARFYRNLSVAVSSLTAEQIEERKAAFDAAVARTEFTKHTDAGRVAHEKAEKAQKKFNDSIKDGKGELESSTIALTEDTKAVYANALAKIVAAGEDDPINIWDTIANLSPDVEKRLQANGTSAVELLNGAMEAAMNGKMTAIEYLQQETGKIRENDALISFDTDWGAFINDIYPAARAIDDMNSAAGRAATAEGVMNSFLGVTGDGFEDLEEDAIELNGELRKTIGLLTSEAISENKAADALDTFAQSARETGGELDGFGKAARTNLSNFASFMDAATEAAINAGEGTPGAIKRIVAGLNSLDAAGIDTSDAFKLVRESVVNNIAGVIGADAAVKAQLGAATDLAGIRSVINGFYSMRLAAEGSSTVLLAEWGRALSVLSATGPTIELPPIQVSQGTVKTALQKLQDQIEKAFKGLDIKVSFQSSLESLGKALTDNGKTFSIFSEAGRSNIGALQNVIDELAVKSGGDVQKFADDLASLRSALVRSGVGASGLKLIDSAIAGVGKKGRSSKKDVNAFANGLKNVSEKKRGILALSDAFNKISSSIKNALSARFVGVDALDNATLGWLDIADAAKAARDSINEATQSIADANAEINKLGSDKKKLEYQLQIAVKYGDTLRAADLRSQIAAIETEVASQNRSIAAANADIASANSQLGVGPNQNPRDIIERNKTLRDMAGRYADVASFMMLNAKPGEDLTKIIDGQIKAFKDNALQMGFTEEQAGKVAGVLREELIIAMKEVPKELKTIVKAETDAALKSISTFATTATTRLNAIPTTITTTHKIVQEGVSKVPTRSGYYPGEVSGGHRWNLKTGKWDKIVTAASGGYITGAGTGTSDSIPAMLSNGEFVVKASAVSAYGLDFMNALNQQRVSSMSGMSSSGASASGPQLVYLSPEDRQLLRAAIDRPVNLYTDNATIAKSANDGNKILAQRGLK